jgi:heavy metal efflux system protein
MEVGRPIAFATLIVVAVFFPLFAMTGIEGRMYSPLAAAVIAAIAAALVLALTLVPLLGGSLLRPPSGNQHEDVWLVRQLKKIYAPVLDKAVHHSGFTMLISIAITVPAIALAFYVGTDFMPKLDEGALLITTIMPPETSLQEVDRVNYRVEDILRSFPEVEDVIRRTGRAERTEDPMLHTMSDVLVPLKKDRKRSPDELEQAMRDRVASVAGISVLFTTPLGMRIDEGLAGTPADISVRIFGPDLDKLAGLADQVQKVISTVQGVADLRGEKLTGLPQLKVTIDRQAVARVGLTPGDVIRTIRIGLAGEEVSQVWLGQRRYDLAIRLRDEKRSDPQAIRTLLVDGHDGSRIPLGQLADIEETFGPGAIRREASSRRIAVESAVQGRDFGSTAREIREKIASHVRMQRDIFLTWQVAWRARHEPIAHCSLPLRLP